MPQPKLKDRQEFMTSTQVCEALGISSVQLDRRLAQNILPVPTRVTEHGVRLFDPTWLQEARDILARPSERMKACQKKGCRPAARAASL